LTDRSYENKERMDFMIIKKRKNTVLILTRDYTERMVLLNYLKI